MLSHPPDRLGVEEVRVVLEYRCHAVRGFHELNIEVPLARLPRHRKRGQRDPAPVEGGPPLAAQEGELKRDVTEGRSSGIPIGGEPLHEERKGIALMCESVLHCFPRSMRQLREPRLARNVGAKDDRVHQGADGSAEARDGAAVGDRAH